MVSLPPLVTPMSVTPTVVGDRIKETAYANTPSYYSQGAWTIYLYISNKFKATQLVLDPLLQ